MMALTGRKLCKLDAICAKLKQINQEPEQKQKDDCKGVPNNVADNNGIHFETQDEPADLSIKPKKCLNNNIIEDVSSHYEHKEIDNAQDLTVLKTKIKENNSPLNGSNESAKNNNLSFSESKIHETNVKESESSPKEGTSTSSSNSIKASPNITPVGSSRRKSRKASTPRNIVQIQKTYDHYDHVDEKDELAEYAINNQNTDFPPEETEEENDKNSYNSSHDSFVCSNESVLDASKSSKEFDKTPDLFKSSIIYGSNSGAPLDLSVSKSEENSTYNGYLSSDDDDDDMDRNLVIDETDYEKTTNSKSETPVSRSPSESRWESSEHKVHAAHLKDYAESTMNELISMYGFSGPGISSDISRQIPVPNYDNFLQQVNGLIHLKKAPVEYTASPGNQPLVNGDDLGSHDRSQPINDSFIDSPSQSPASATIKVEDNGKPQNDRFTSSAAYISSVYSSPPVNPNPTSKNLLPDYSKYLKRYNNGNECGGKHCIDLNYKEHYHCIDCNFHVFIKKEEMVRHYKWHRKREESLQHGFLRFSPLDNCTKRFGPCTHNGRQTHYHCLQNACDKVYISTSDVQMHANYHRKDSAIMSEGFQRFRATEDCGTQTCAFYGQRTTHFHCLRPTCKFTFKNKADMEKHKSYHQKDEVLGRDGFKKFMKYEFCGFVGCRYSKVSNHIHCIRDNCDYVLHSTAQLYSHKRKHERRDFENAYKKYRDKDGHKLQHIQPMPNMAIPRADIISHFLGGSSGIHLPQGLKRPAEQTEPLELKKPKLEPLSDDEDIPSSSASPCMMSDGASTPFFPSSPKTEQDSMDEENSNTSDKFADDYRSLKENDNLDSSLNLPINSLTAQKESSALPTQVKVTPDISGPQSVSSMPCTLPTGWAGQAVMTVPNPASTVLQPPKTIYMERREKDDSWKNYLVRYTANDPCNPRCQYLYKDHYHCRTEGCLVLFKSKDGVREHARFHELQDRITPIAYKAYNSSESCPEGCQYSEKEIHYHCIWTGCTHVVPHTGPTFGRLEHYRVHEYARAAAGKSYNRGTKISPEDNSIRRRGRPPKYPKIDLPRIPKVLATEEEIRRSHVSLKEGEIPSNLKVINGFRIFRADDPCPDEECNFVGKTHFHCARPRCYTVTDRVDVLNLHAKDFHSFVKILDGFEFFDRNVSCRRLNCPNNQINRHFHCARPRCDYSFIRHSTMPQHEKKHQQSDGIVPTSPVIKQDSPVSTKSFVPIVPAASTVPLASPPLTPVIKTAGTFIPVSPGSKLSNIPLSAVMTNTGQSFTTGMPPGALITVPQLATDLARWAIPQISSVPLTINPVQALPASVTTTQLMSGLSSTPLITAGGAALAVSAVNSTSTSQNSSVPLTVLLQRGINQIPQPSWSELRAKMHYAVSQNCGRPFCKLKKKDHYHCYDCNQAFSDPARLRSHVGKHGLKFKRPEHATKLSSPTPIAPKQEMDTTQTSDIDMDPDEAKCLADGKIIPGVESDEYEEMESNSSLNLNPSTFSIMISKAQEENKFSSDSEISADATDLKKEKMDEGDYADSKDMSSRSGRKITKIKHNDFIDSNAVNVGKMKKVSSPRINSKDESVPNGYSRWRFNEDCQYNKCAYRQSVTHFHCRRSDCGYGFSDRSRLVQHTLRHERIDSITGGEMQQYRINQDCGRDGCEFNMKMSHFHCHRCAYSCTDSSKVLTHRKFHAKLDSINSQGFQKYSITEDCKVNVCPYAGKQNHFHCLVEECRTPVLGPAQMSSHKLKHS